MVYDLIIVGGGTAGLCAALYALRGGLHTLLLEGAVPGGQIVASPQVENFPALPRISGAEYAQKLLAQVEQLGPELKLELKYEAAESVRPQSRLIEVRTAEGVYRAKTLIWAAGLAPRRLNCPGEERFIGRGISFCATCDGAFYRQKEVAVIGGGNTALEEALFLSGLCGRVHLLHRGEVFRAEAAYVQRVRRAANIQLHMQTQAMAFEGGNHLERLLIQTPQGERVLPVDAAFLAVGKLPQNSLLAEHIELDAAGYVQAGEDCRTRLAGVFAAGDCRAKPLRQLVTAAADGAVAAGQAVAYLRQQGEDFA